MSMLHVQPMDTTAAPAWGSMTIGRTGGGRLANGRAATAERRRPAVRMAVDERRRGLRVAQARPVKVLDGAAGRTLVGETVDVSVTGLRVRLAAGGAGLRCGRGGRHQRRPEPDRRAVGQPPAADPGPRRLGPPHRWRRRRRCHRRRRVRHRHRGAARRRLNGSPENSEPRPPTALPWAFSSGASWVGRTLPAVCLTLTGSADLHNLPALRSGGPVPPLCFRQAMR